MSDPIMLMSARSIFAEAGIALTGVKREGLYLPNTCWWGRPVAPGGCAGWEAMVREKGCELGASFLIPSC